MMRSAPWNLVLPGALAIATGLAIVRLLWTAGRALAIVVLAATLAAALAPIVDRLARRMPRALAVSLVYLTGAGLAALLGWVTLPGLSVEMQELLGRSGEMTAAMRQRLSWYLPDALPLEQVISTLTDQLLSLLKQVPTIVASFTFGLLVVVFLSLYLLMVSPDLHQFAVRLFRKEHRRRASLILCRTAHSMGGYFRGTAINALIVGVITWIGLRIAGLEFTLPLAVLAALGEFVPYVGPIAAAVPAIGMALLESLQKALLVLLLYIGLHQLDSHILTPNIMRTQTDIHPATVIVALTVGFEVGGLLGAIVAIPIFAAAQVVMLRVIVPSIRKGHRRQV
jgi:predicted PurR-regulated permease PerM